MYSKFFSFSIYTSKLGKCKLDRVLGEKTVLFVLWFLLFWSDLVYWSSGLLFIRSSGFGLILTFILAINLPPTTLLEETYFKLITQPV